MYILGTTTDGILIEIHNIIIIPKTRAYINYRIINTSRTGMFPESHMMELIIEGEQYARWGTDDTILFHIICLKHNLEYKAYTPPPTVDKNIIFFDESGNINTETTQIPNPYHEDPFSKRF
jgi:hypothetical protein